MCSRMPWCFPTVSMVGNDEIISMLGHALHWLPEVSAPKGGTKNPMGVKSRESFSIASWPVVASSICSVFPTLQSTFSNIISLDIHNNQTGGWYPHRHFAGVVQWLAPGHRAKIRSSSWCSNCWLLSIDVSNYVLLPCWCCVHLASFRNVTGSWSKNRKKNNKIHKHTHETQPSALSYSMVWREKSEKAVTFLVFAHASHSMIVF